MNVWCSLNKMEYMVVSVVRSKKQKGEIIPENKGQSRLEIKFIFLVMISGGVTEKYPVELLHIQDYLKMCSHLYRVF